MEKEKTFEELARDVVRRQENEEALTGTDIETTSKLGVPKTVRGAATEEEKAEVREMYRKGIGVCEIARRTGFAQSTISRWVGTRAIDRSKSVHAKKNEPAPSANDTSSKTKNTNITINNTPKSEICQEEIDTISCTNEVISGLKFMYPNAVIKRTMTDSDRCYVDFKCGNKNYSMCLSRDTYSDKQETDNADQN